MDIEITRYNDSMRPQVIKLFEEQYRLDVNSFEKLFKDFYFHPFQKDKCLLVVALDGSTVAGFQSFFYWPYSYNGKTVRSFQSGNSIVHPGYRGKGIFNMMLRFFEEQNKVRPIDFLMGFPVNESLKNFIKDGWHSVLSLKWYVKPCNVFGFFGSRISSCENISGGCSYFENDFLPEGIIGMAHVKEFNDWRTNYQNSGKHYTYRFKSNSSEIKIHLKKNKRKKIINELIIGAILYNGPEAIKLTGEALEGLMQEVRKSFSVHFLSASVNDACKFDLRLEFEKLGFNKTNKSIHFIVKSVSGNEFAMRPDCWFLSRSDVDTW